eukprot:78061_1
MAESSERSRHRKPKIVKPDSPNTQNDHLSVPSNSVDGGSDSEYSSASQQMKRVKSWADRIRPVPRQSLFEQMSSDGNINGSVNLIASVMIVICVVHLVTHFYDHGSVLLLDDTLLNVLMRDFYVVIVIGLIMTAYSFTALLIQRIIICGVKGFWLNLMHHGIQTGLFICSFSLTYLYKLEWSVLQSGPLTLHMMVMFMKMHSFVMVNREMRDLRDLDLAEGRITKKQLKDADVYPNNVPVKSWVYFLCAPTLVFAPEYPRNERIRPGYLLKKFAAGAGCLILLYSVINHHFMPTLAKYDTMDPLEMWIRMVVPVLLIWLILFYFIWEVLLNFTAEILRFADRQFYLDWWNSTTFEEFARKWNRPVHAFLLRHIYMELVQKWKASKTTAILMTFLFSAALHELVLTMTCRVFHPFLFTMMVAEIVLVFASHILKRSTFGNFFFWFGMLFGIPLVATQYGREYMKRTL